MAVGSSPTSGTSMVITMTGRDISIFYQIDPQTHAKCYMLNTHHTNMKLSVYIARSHQEGTHLYRSETPVWHSGFGLHHLLLPHVLLLHLSLQATMCIMQVDSKQCRKSYGRVFAQWLVDGVHQTY